MAEALISFDYRRSAPPPFVRRVLEIRISEQYHSVLLAFAAAWLAIAGAWFIESRRLHHSLEMESIYQRRFDAAQRALRHARLYEIRINRLVALDRRIRGITSSGYEDARRLVEIANRLPNRTWLTGISYDGNALAIEGRAADLRTLGSVVRNLNGAADLHNPSLVSATAVSDSPKDLAIKYTLHVDAGTE